MVCGWTWRLSRAVRVAAGWGRGGGGGGLDRSVASVTGLGVGVEWASVYMVADRSGGVYGNAREVLVAALA